MRPICSTEQIYLPVKFRISDSNIPRLNHRDQKNAYIIPKIQNISAAKNACDEV